MKKIIYCLVKIFKDCDNEYADNLLNSGELYCQALKNFKVIEDGEVRGDKYEGLIHWIQPRDCVISLELPENIVDIPREITITEADLTAPAAIQTTEYEYHKIYCMYAIAIDEFSFKYSTEEERISLQKEINDLISKQIEFDEKISSELGNIAIVITNVKKFIDRVKQHCGNDVHHGLVGYFNDEAVSVQFQGIESIFRKRKLYSYQNEYRFAFSSRDQLNSKIFHIGDLKDIAYKTTVSELKELISISVK
ncbi:hypothetical protein [Methylomonas sp. DH-1]|uniref:hypothetical protein n=1 Tax=Methylomonas sp. (strain DH-1) TaxID=1727196 RepID=UPI0007C97788|nr:hypothetical protein [Methylomonas sp. DH-1]ANE54673.1 hypothetical protein AYM39_05395 [Methylomonas sp. DH-1]